MEEIGEALERCDLFLAVGTSGVVYPAAGFVRALPSGARKIEVNRETSAVSSAFDEHRVGAAGVELPRLVEELLLNPARL
jgi:NAD-dependent deacetylase